MQKANSIVVSPEGTFVLFALCYAAVLFISAIATHAGSPLPFLVVAFMVGVVVELVAVWCVFGYGNFVWRFFVSHCLGAVCGLGVGLGLTLVATGDGTEWRDVFLVLKLSVLAAIPASMTAQLIYWFVRWSWGWHFYKEGVSVDPKLGIKDIMAFTFMIALSFATPQLASHELRTVGAQDAFRQSLLSFSWGLLGTTAIVTIATVPIIGMIMTSKESGVGCLYSMVYAFCLLMAMMMLLLLLGAGMPGSAVGFLGVLLGGYTGAIALPLLVTRENGLMMASRTRRKKGRAGD